MYIQPSFVSNGQSTEAIEPCERALHNPSVTPQFLAAFDASPSDTRCDAPLAKSRPIGFGVVPLVSVHLVRSLAGSASSPLEGRDSIYHLLQHLGVRYVSSRTLQGEGYAPSLYHKMALRAGGRRTELPLSVGFGPVPCALFLPLWLQLFVSPKRLLTNLSHLPH